MVPVLDENKLPLQMISFAKARILLFKKQAKIYRRYPFVIILTKPCDELKKIYYTLKIDPGAKITGMVIVSRSINDEKIVMISEIAHRAISISANMITRSSVRRNRRNRKTRYRPARWQNRRRPKGWLGPSTKSLLSNIMTFIRRWSSFCNIQEIFCESNIFDIPKMRNPLISGKEYQEGPLKGSSIREYLLAKSNCCFYCEKQGKYEIDHFIPKSVGGSDALANRVLACHECNTLKTNKKYEEFLEIKYAADKVKLVYFKKKCDDKYKTIEEFKYATKMNVICKRLEKILYEEKYKFAFFPSNNTAENRRKLFPMHDKNIVNNHWLDAACVGNNINSSINLSSNLLNIKSIGYGSRQRQRMDKHGKPAKTKQGIQVKPNIRKKKFDGFQRGDMISGSNKNISCTGVVKGCEMLANGAAIVVENGGKKYKFKSERVKKIQSFDGYSYTYQQLTTDELLMTGNKR